MFPVESSFGRTQESLILTRFDLSSRGTHYAEEKARFLFEKAGLRQV